MMLKVVHLPNFHKAVFIATVTSIEGHAQMCSNYPILVTQRGTLWYVVLLIILWKEVSTSVCDCIVPARGCSEGELILHY